MPSLPVHVVPDEGFLGHLHLLEPYGMGWGWPLACSARLALGHWVGAPMNSLKKVLIFHLRISYLYMMKWDIYFLFSPPTPPISFPTGHFLNFISF